MKNVLKLIVTAAIATTLAGAVMAQQAGPTNGGLTNGQGQNPGKDGDKTQLRNDLKKITTDYRESLLKILTPAQQESFKKLYKEAVAKNRKDGKGGKKGGLNKGGN